MILPYRKGVAKLKISIIINIYIDPFGKENKIFDHPTSLKNFETENTFEETLESINNLRIEDDDKIELCIFAIAEDGTQKFDQEIRTKVEETLQKSRFPGYLFTNTDIHNFSETYDSELFSVQGYPEIRNLGFIFPFISGNDYFIQIDDDEIVRPDYIIKMKEIFHDNPDVYALTAPYEKNGTIYIKTEDQLKSWAKYSSMNKDMIAMTEDEGITPTMFGFGGNMVLRKEFVSQVCYPPKVPRGEDFSLILASKVIQKNGYPEIGIEKDSKVLSFYFTPSKEMTIDHRPPYEAKANFLHYIEKNLKRFIMEWNFFKNQEDYSIEELKNDSNYMTEMIGFDDFKDKIIEITDELEKEMDFSKEEVYKLRSELLEFVEEWAGRDRFAEYKSFQLKYRNFLRNYSENEEIKKMIEINRYSG